MMLGAALLMWLGWWLLPAAPPPQPAQPSYVVSGATSGLCDGCHSVNYDITRKTVTEWNVGCERCHGPGSDHASRPARTNIVNPARLDPMAAVDVCVQCHSEGHPPAPVDSPG